MYVCHTWPHATCHYSSTVTKEVEILKSTSTHFSISFPFPVKTVYYLLVEVETTKISVAFAQLILVGDVFARTAVDRIEQPE